MNIGMSTGDDATRRAIDRAIAPKPALVDFSKVAPFTWTRVYFFGPYGAPDLVFEKAGIHWDDADDADLALGNEGTQMVVFVRGDEVVRWVDYSTGLAWVGCLVRDRGWARATARFRLLRGSFLRLVPRAGTARSCREA
jgi:hypothetical protein